jgi:hypothetical protein
VLTSGKGGFPIFKGVLDSSVMGAHQPLTVSQMADVVANAQAVLDHKPGRQPFARCLACLVYAKATLDDDFMKSDPVCAPCYEEYCYAPPKRRGGGGRDARQQAAEP